MFPENTTARNKKQPNRQQIRCLFFVQKIVWQKSRAYTVNYPPLMRGIPRLEVGASAPWSFSFPAYEESSLQDDCNHPNLTISTGDPRRPVRFIHNEGLSFLCVRMSGCACHPFRLIQDILCCLLIPVHGMSAYRTEIHPVGQF